MREDMSILTHIKQHWENHRENTFVIDSFTGISYTYGDIRTKAQILSQFLKEHNISKGDRIAILMNSCIEFVQLYFAAMYMGCVAVPINPQLGLEIAKFVVSDSGAKLILVDKEIEFASEFIEDTRTVFFNTITEYPDSSFNAPAPFHTVSETDELIIVYTSGTTSKPKGVIHTFGSIFSNGIEFAKIMQLGNDSRFLNILPMAYLGGYYNLLIIPFISGGSVVLAPPFQAANISGFWRPIIEYSVNTLWLVPTIVAMLMELDMGNDGIEYCQQNQIIGLIGTAPLNTNLRNSFESKYGFKLFENYALSETLFITTNSPDMSERVAVGRLMPRISVKIINSHGELAKNNEDGEVHVNTYSLMKGYQGDESKLNPDDQWFPTGDIGRFLDTGDLAISGRKKDLIIKGGINISPAYIENIVNEHPSIKDCCIVGVPHNVMGEEIVCVLRIVDGKQFDEVEAELKKLIAKRLPLIYRPTYILELPDFPVTSTGKVQKHIIRKWASEEKDKARASKKKRFESRQKADFFRTSRVVSDISQAMSIKYNNKVYEMQNDGIDIIVLSLGEAFFDIPLYPFCDLPFPQIYHYSHSRGVLELREKISSYYLKQYEVQIDSQNEIIITAGSKIAIYMSLLAIINPDDEVLIHEPAWVSYPEQVKLCHGTPVMIPHSEGVFDFENYISNRTKAIIINNPNNPSGKVYSVEEITHLTRLAERYGLFILSDEAYSDFLLNSDNFISLGNVDKEKRYSIICNSMSKNYGMSGWRIGYVVSNEALINQILKINQHLITCPASILEYYMAEHFDDVLSVTKKQIVDVVHKRRMIVEYLDKIGLSYMQGTSTFYIFVSIENATMKSEEFSDTLLERKHICVVPGIGYGESCDKYIRISIGTEPLDRIFYAMDEIKKMINE